MKNRLIKLLLIALCLVTVFGCVTASAYDAYDTYTYSIDGLSMKSPAAYSASVSMNSYDICLVTDKSGIHPTDKSANTNSSRNLVVSYLVCNYRRR